MNFVSAKTIIPVFLLSILISACDNQYSEVFREPQQLTSGNKEDRLDYGCKIVVLSSVVDGQTVDRLDDNGDVDESIEILPVVDENEIITVKVEKFGDDDKITGFVVNQPEFVTMALSGEDDDGNQLIRFSSDESFIYVGGVTNKRGKVSQCSIGITVIPEDDLEDEE